MHAKLSLDPAILKGSYEDCHPFLVREESKVREKLRPLLKVTYIETSLYMAAWFQL